MRRGSLLWPCTRSLGMLLILHLRMSCRPSSGRISVGKPGHQGTVMRSRRRRAAVIAELTNTLTPLRYAPPVDELSRHRQQSPKLFSLLSPVHCKALACSGAQKSGMGFSIS